MTKRARIVAVAGWLVAWSAMGAGSAGQPAAGGEPQLTLPRCGRTPLPVHRHGAAILGRRLYVIGGGTPQGWTTAVSSGVIGDDGRISDWRNEIPLPEFRSYIGSAVTVVGNRLYVAGGNTCRRPNTDDKELRKTADVLWTEVGPDGMLKPWRRSIPFPGPPLSCVAACSDGKSLILTGGSNDLDVANTVHVALLGEDGDPLGWESTRPLPTPLWFHGAAFQGGRIYVWGGLTRKDRSYVNSHAYSAPFAHGRIQGEWRHEASMPHPVYSAGFIGAGGHLLCLGGRYANSYPTNILWYCRLTDDGHAPAWQMIKTDLESWVNHAAAFDPRSGSVYVTGGNLQVAPTDIRGRLLDTIQAFRLDGPPPAP